VGTVFLGVGLLFVVLLPLGLVLLRLLEYARGKRLTLSSLERVLVAPYLSVGLLLALASVSLPIYNVWLVAGPIAAGPIALGFVWRRQSFERIRTLLRAPRLRIVSLVVIGTAALLFVEVLSAGTRAFPNAYDGSFESLYTKLILTHHLIPWTLAPYGQIGIIYPQGTAIWFTLPVLLFGWPIESSPVTIPLLFLSLAVPASFCLGERLGGPTTSRGEVTGLLFAGFFGLVASWPRLFVGGSYDFAIGLPLFLLSVGWLRPFIRPPAREWKDVLLFGGLLGILTVFSDALGETLFLLLVANLIVSRNEFQVQFRQWWSRVVLIAMVGLAFVGRSIGGLVIWFDQPGHVLNALGSPPYATQPGLPSPSSDTYVGNLDPFVPWKWKLSPFPALSLELQLLLVAGIALCVLLILVPRTRLNDLLPRELVAPIVVGTTTLLLWTCFLISVSATWVGTSILDVLASLYESSFLLFIFFQMVALIPLVALAEALRDRRAHGERSAARPVPEIASRSGLRSPKRRGVSPSWGTGAALAILLAAPLMTGAAVTATQAPNFLSEHLAGLSNVTSSDVAALEWAGTHLPACSRVLVGPGSAGQFLPLYADVQVVFPMMPLPLNLSYYIAVGNLTDGVYSNSTRAALSSLPVTEVFVTGQTSVSYPPLQAAPMAGSPDFSILFAQGDATIFEFLLGSASLNCPP
jgi:hypothetical protein